MTPQEMKERYSELYDYMAESKDPKNMKAFGRVMCAMMDDMIANTPSKAEEYINRLEAVKWRNYLTPKEAEKIVADMQPKAPWSREVWRNAMDQFDIPTEEPPYFNSCALWVEMNKMYSDHANTIADNILHRPLAEIPPEQIVIGINAMALDTLKDVDGVYNIRSYFGV